MQLFEKTGFSWNRSAVPPGQGTSVEQSAFCYKRSLAEFVHDAGALEGNPLTYPEVMTLLDGVTVGGHKLADQQQIQNLGAAAKRLFSMVQNREFRMDKCTSDEFHRLVGTSEALIRDISVVKGIHSILRFGQVCIRVKRNNIGRCQQKKAHRS